MPEHIAWFELDSAEYIVGDGSHKVLLRVNYKENTYSVFAGSQAPSEEFRQEISQVATGLLGRKHGVNLASKL